MASLDVPTLFVVIFDHVQTIYFWLYLGLRENLVQHLDAWSLLNFELSCHLALLHSSAIFLLFWTDHFRAKIGFLLDDEHQHQTEKREQKMALHYDMPKFGISPGPTPTPSPPSTIATPSNFEVSSVWFLNRLIHF